VCGVVHGQIVAGARASSYGTADLEVTPPVCKSATLPA
jgi:hypothetical protein